MSENSIWWIQSESQFSIVFNMFFAFNFHIIMWKTPCILTFHLQYRFILLQNKAIYLIGTTFSCLFTILSWNNRVIFVFFNRLTLLMCSMQLQYFTGLIYALCYSEALLWLYSGNDCNMRPTVWTGHWGAFHLDWEPDGYANINCFKNVLLKVRLGFPANSDFFIVIDLEL